MSLGGLYFRNLSANLLGYGSIVALNLFTPTNFFKPVKAFLFAEEGGRVVLVASCLAVILLGIFLQYLIHRPISEFINEILAGKKVMEDLQQRARRRLLNLPFIIGVIDLAIWIVLSAVVVFLFRLLNIVPLKASLFILFRGTMIGMIASTISFFLIEDYSRRYLIPLLFTEGRLITVPGTIKISILRRIRVLYAAGTTIPMILIVGTLFFVFLKLQGTTISATQLYKETLVFTLILCGIFVAINLRLNFLVGTSILNPLRELLKIMRRVRSGDFTQRIQVLSNDEIGVLGDAGNEMISGLAEREKIREAFGKYVSPEIRDKILTGHIPLNGERTVATLLFADLRGFTPYVEQNPPEEVIRSMRGYFTAMEKVIHRHQGLVLQFVGDEIEAVFGVPLRYSDHADKAVLAALEMRENLEMLNRGRAERGVQSFSHGIGIYTGEVLAGNTGSKNRLSYALIGDTVNLAKRIEELTKEFHCDILVSEQTVKRLEKPFQMTEGSSIMVKGHSTPITVHQVT